MTFCAFRYEFNIPGTPTNSIKYFRLYWHTFHRRRSFHSFLNSSYPSFPERSTCWNVKEEYNTPHWTTVFILCILCILLTKAEVLFSLPGSKPMNSYKQKSQKLQNRFTLYYGQYAVHMWQKTCKRIHLSAPPNFCKCQQKIHRIWTLKQTTDAGE